MWLDVHFEHNSAFWTKIDAVSEYPFRNSAKTLGLRSEQLACNNQTFNQVWVKLISMLSGDISAMIIIVFFFVVVFFFLFFLFFFVVVVYFCIDRMIHHL